VDIRFAEGPQGLVAYTTVGSGPVDLLWCENWMTNLEVAWEQPAIERLHRRLGSFCRLVLFDKRGSGVSDPMPSAKPLPEPTIEAGVEDALSVLDALGLERSCVLGTDTGGWIAMQLAAMVPQRVERLILVDPQLKVARTDDYPAGMSPAELDGLVTALRSSYGREGGIALQFMAPELAGEPGWQRWMARFERLSCPPGVMAGLWAQAAELDFRPVVPAIQAPTLVVEHDEGPWGRHPGRTVAAAIPGAVHRAVPGRNTALWAPQPEQLFQVIETYLTGAPPVAAHPTERVLATVLFTDIVDSTRIASQVGDRAWRDLLDRHDSEAKAIVGRHRGRFVGHTGDGLLASFDGPTRAVRCGAELCRDMEQLGLTIRVGIHTGEVEMRGEDLSGIGVHVAARLLALCDPGEMLVTRTVKDLVIGSGIGFVDRGSHVLKGIDEPWHVYHVVGA
jgi:class 3 adenylate cyclase